ncbi:MAG: isochorismatase [Proteobacteria bacterium]|nr:MAG: isochorismatase [Pseudomonadota bacterium]
MHPTQLPAHVIDRVVFRRGRLHGFETVAPEKTALVVVDMQNVFCAKGAAVEVPAAREIVGNINRLARATRASGGTVVWLQMTIPRWEDWSLVLDNLLSPAVAERTFAEVQPGTEGHALWPEMETDPADLVIAKNRYSAFLPSSSELTKELRAIGIESVIIVGTLTNVCCESSARDAAMQDFKTFMISDANAARTDEEHMATLINFIQTFGDVRSTEEMIGLLQAAQPAARRA